MIEWVNQNDRNVDRATSHTLSAPWPFHALLLFVLLFVLLFSEVSTSAQPRLPVRMRLEPLSIRGRSGSPIAVRIKLEYNAAQMLQGDLVLEVYNSFYSKDDLMATIRYDGIVLQGTDYIFNTVLPPIEHSYQKQYLIVGWYETDTQRIPLTADPDLIDPPEPHELLSIGSYERATLICSVSGHSDYQKASPNRLFLNNALSLDNYSPVSASRTSRRQSGPGSLESQRVLNYTASWDVFNLPEDPLHLCCFDIVLLADGAFSRLEELQLQALTTWVEAGGSLCVLADDNRLTGQHVQFLQAMFRTDESPDLHFALADDSTLLVICDKREPVINRHFGLGRITLLPNVTDLSARLTGAELGGVVGHLWKLRSDSPVFQGQKWQPRDLGALLQERGLILKKDGNGFYAEGKQGSRQRFNQGRRFRQPEDLATHLDLNYELQPKGSPLASASETALLPEGVQMVPTYVIAMLLIAYVVTIGPVDYLVLGYFKARKYTWLLFPLVTAAFTAVTVSIAHQYMASTDSGGAISVVDVTDDGRPVRRTDLQMHFYASQTTLSEEVSQSFVVPGQMLIATNMQYGGPQGPRATSTGVHYSGRFPQAYNIQHDLRQWEPQLVRSMTLAPEAFDVLPIPWNDASLVTTDAGRRKLLQHLQKAAPDGSAVAAIVLNQGARFSVGGGGFLFSPGLIERGEYWVQSDVRIRRYESTPGVELEAVGLLESACRTGTRDFFSLVSQVSPQGSASLEDLPILDPTDANQWLLMVAVKGIANHTMVYRRLYRVNDSPGDQAL
ncbi:MAG: hypothetical protein GY903_27420 [Fuerstiella sp.]|nr:hypothetical protein [Fuerstiella sp.]MCP4858229.1 hypothetical protein [Fuerstiella sp.]